MSYRSLRLYSIAVWSNFLSKDNIQIFTRFPFKVPFDKIFIYGDRTANFIKTLPKYCLLSSCVIGDSNIFYYPPYCPNTLNAFSQP